MKARTATIGHDSRVAVGDKCRASAGSTQRARASRRRSCASHPRIRPFQASLVHRYYTPKVGQFLSVDPTVLKTVQAYAYANDDPVNGEDPTGQCVTCNSLRLLSNALGDLSTYLGLGSLLLGIAGADFLGLDELGLIADTAALVSIMSDETTIASLAVNQSAQNVAGAGQSAGDIVTKVTILNKDSNAGKVIGGAGYFFTGLGVYQSGQNPCT